MPVKPSASSPLPCLECGLRGGFGFTALEQPCTKSCRRLIWMGKCRVLAPWPVGRAPSWVSVRPSLGALDGLPRCEANPASIS